MDILKKSNANKYLTQIPTDERKYKLKNYKEQWNSTRDLMKSKTNNSGYHDEKYMEITFSSPNNLHLKETLKLYNMMIVIRSVFHEGNKYYPQFSINECKNCKNLHEFV